jgi:hypothetical protein
MLALVRYPSQTLRKRGQPPIGKVGHERKLGAASILKLMPSCSKKRHNRIVADLDPALCQRAAKPACFVIQFTSGAPERGSVATKATFIHRGLDLARHF